MSFITRIIHYFMNPHRSMPHFLNIRQESQPCFLGDHTPKHPFGVRDQDLPSPEFDKQLLD